MTALALIPHDNCPDCGAILRTRTVAEPALLRHGGILERDQVNSAQAVKGPGGHQRQHREHDKQFLQCAP